jgi:glycosyltransferase involved in cell wall biosynthesis
VVGRIEPEKGQEEFVRCARVLTQRFAGISFALAGAPLFSSPAYYERVVEQARGLPVDFLGWQEDLKTLFAGLDLLVVPSKSHEATTRVIPEAFSAGLPVVAFPSGGIPEIVRDGSNGFLAAQPTPAALADRISDVLRMNPADVDIVTGRAHRDWQERFSLPKFQEQVCRLVSVVARQQCW